MAFLGLRTKDAGLGGGSVADVLIKALTGDPEREMALARGRSDLELDAYRQKQMEAAAAQAQAAAAKYQAEADTEAAILNQNHAAGSAAGNYFAGALPVPVDPDPAYTVGEPLPVSVDQTPTMANLYRDNPDEPVPVYLQGTDETDIVPYADQMANYDRQRAFEQERAKAVFMGGGNAAQVAQGANLLQGGFTQANETDPDALRRNMPLLGINPTDETVLGEDDLAGTKSRIAVATATEKAKPGETGRPMTPEERTAYGVPDNTPAYITDSGKVVMPGSSSIKLDLSSEVEERKRIAASLGMKEGTPAWMAFVATGNIPKETQLSATDKRMIQEADDLVLANQQAVDALTGAITGPPGQSLNERAGSGMFAGAQSWLARNDPSGIISDETGEATTELNNVILGTALGSLKAIFGGNPTEGERAILVDLQASVDKTPAERRIIIDRAIALAMQRLRLNQQRAEELRSGTYFQSDDAAATAEPSAAGGSDLEDALGKY